MVTSPTVPVERRNHVRFAASELNGLQGARVKYGHDIEVIDLSASGVLFETAAPLTQASTIVLEFSGPTKTVLIPSRVLRCQSVATIDYRKRSKGACAFKRPLALKDLVTGTTPARRDTPSSLDESVGTSHAIVGKYRDGRLISGYTSDFSPSKTYMHVSRTPSATEKQLVELTELEALFFMRDSRDTGDVQGAPGTDGTYGRKVALLLPNGEELTGSTLNYSRHTSGVFMYPFESDFGVARVFVTQSGIRNLRLL
jgi:hypothetical protein